MRDAGYVWRTAGNRPLSSARHPEAEFETSPVRLRIIGTAIFGAVRIVHVMNVQAQPTTAEALSESSDPISSSKGETGEIASLSDTLTARLSQPEIHRRGHAAPDHPDDS